MKKKTIIIAPLIITIFIVFSNQFYCAKNDNLDLFGKSDQSPLVSDSSSKADGIQNVFRKIFKLYDDRVVFITTEQIVRVRSHPIFDDPAFRDFFGSNRGLKQQKRKGLGTGFVISEDGYICTNHHVIDKVDKITIRIADKSYNAKIIGSDKQTDVALLKIDSKEKFKPVYFGDSDKVRVGDWAIAIGNPFGLNNSFTVGVISAIGRKNVDFMGSSHIQTDASINPGNSGGPLINSKGEVVGINRMIYSKSGGYMGIGFAIPVNTAQSILNQLKKHRKVKRGYLGISIAKLTDEYKRQLGLKSNDGAFIGEIVAGSPADKGGLLVGDVILKVEGDTIKGFTDLIRIVNNTDIGKTLKITIWRNRKLLNLFIKVAERPNN